MSVCGIPSGRLGSVSRTELEGDVLDGGNGRDGLGGGDGMDACYGTGADTWLWEFGDGATSTKRNPSHTFADAGRYRVTLNAAGADGSVASVAKDVTVAP